MISSLTYSLHFKGPLDRVTLKVAPHAARLTTFALRFGSDTAADVSTGRIDDVGRPADDCESRTHAGVWLAVCWSGDHRNDSCRRDDCRLVTPASLTRRRPVNWVLQRAVDPVNA